MCPARGWACGRVCPAAGGREWSAGAWVWGVGAVRGARAGRGAGALCPDAGSRDTRLWVRAVAAGPRRPASAARRVGALPGAALRDLEVPLWLPGGGSGGSGGGGGAAFRGEGRAGGRPCLVGVRTSFISPGRRAARPRQLWVCSVLLPPAAAVGAAQPSAKTRRPPPASVRCRRV